MDGHGNVSLACLLELIRLLPGPELDSRIPATANYNWRPTIRLYETEDVFDRHAVLAYSHYLVCL